MDSSQQHLFEFVLSIAGAMILLLLGIIGFWMQKWIRSTDALTEAITNLKVLFAGTQTSMANLEKNCSNRCRIVDETLSKHSGSINDHHTEIELLKAYKNK